MLSPTKREGCPVCEYVYESPHMPWASLLASISYPTPPQVGLLDTCLFTDSFILVVIRSLCGLFLWWCVLEEGSELELCHSEFIVKGKVDMKKVL